MGRLAKDDELGHRQEWNTNSSTALSKETARALNPSISLSIKAGGAACDERCREKTTWTYSYWCATRSKQQ